MRPFMFFFTKEPDNDEAECFWQQTGWQADHQQKLIHEQKSSDSKWLVVLACVKRRNPSNHILYLYSSFECLHWYSLIIADSQDLKSKLADFTLKTLEYWGQCNIFV